MLYVVDLDTMERTEVAPDIGGWEFGTHRLHLASTGLIVGESIGEANHAIFVAAVPGSPAAGGPLPTAADSAWTTTYHDCTDCPHAFTVTPDGRTVHVDRRRHEHARRPLPRPAERRIVPVVAVPDGFAVDVDVDGATRRALVLRRSPGATAGPGAVRTGRRPTTLEGVTATQSPLAVPPDQAGCRRHSTTIPTPTTSPTTTAPATPAGVMLATAGDDGDHRHRERRRGPPARPAGRDRPADPGRRGDLPAGADDARRDAR